MPEQATQLLFLEQTLIVPPLAGWHKDPGLTHVPLRAMQRRSLLTHAPALPLPAGQMMLGAAQLTGVEGEGLGVGVTEGAGARAGEMLGEGVELGEGLAAGVGAMLGAGTAGEGAAGDTPVGGGGAPAPGAGTGVGVGLGEAGGAAAGVVSGRKNTKLSCC